MIRRQRPHIIPLSYFPPLPHAWFLRFSLKFAYATTAVVRHGHAVCTGLTCVVSSCFPLLKFFFRCVFPFIRIFVTPSTASGNSAPSALCRARISPSCSSPQGRPPRRRLNSSTRLAFPFRVGDLVLMCHQTNCTAEAPTRCI